MIESKRWKFALFLNTTVLGTSVLLPALASAQQSQPTIYLKKTASCGCCALWGDRMKSAGFTVKHEDMAMGQLMNFKKQNGIRNNFSCHTARIGDYTIEGHISAREIRRLLREQPDAIGLSVPGMPIGSPGMDFDHTREAYDVLLLRKDGSTEIFAHYPASDAPSPR